MEFHVSRELIHGRSEDRWWLVQKPSVSKGLILHRFTKVVLENTSLRALRHADNNVAQADIMLAAWRAATDAHHKANPDVGKAVYHVSGDNSRGRGSGLILRQHCNDDVVASHASQRVAIGVMFSDIAGGLVFLVKKGFRCNQLRGEGADPSNCIAAGIQHYGNMVEMG